MTYSQIIQILASNILIYFDEIYVNAEIVSLKKEKFPAVSMASEWLTLAPTDQKETIYIRRSGDDEVTEEMKLSSCAKSYRMRSSLRIVFFKDHAASQNDILAHLMQAVLTQGTKLRSITRDKWKLQKEESSGNYNFGPTTAYFAIDIYAIWTLLPDDCLEDFCADILNPLKKESCLAAVTIS